MLPIWAAQSMSCLLVRTCLYWWENTTIVDGVCMIVGTRDMHHVVALKHINYAIRSVIAQRLQDSMISLVLTLLKSPTCWNAEHKMCPVILESFTKLGAMDTPSEKVYDVLEEFVGQLYCPCSYHIDI